VKQAKRLNRSKKKQEQPQKDADEEEIMQP